MVNGRIQQITLVASPNLLNQTRSALTVSMTLRSCHVPHRPEVVDMKNKATYQISMCRLTMIIK